MAVRQKGAISFGLVYIPVELYTATQDSDVRFNQLAKETHERVRYVKTCAGCKKELDPDDIVKGFQYEKDKYVIIDDADLEKIKTDKDRSIQILQFTTLADIPPVYYEKAYRVKSQKGGEKALEALRQAMLAEGKVAVGRTVMGSKETLLALVPDDKGIMLQTLYFQDEVKELPEETDHPKLADAELDMAKQLVQSMTKPFDPAEYHDEYQEKLRDLIANKIAGKEIVEEKDSEQPANIINLMDALKQSLQQQEDAAPEKKPTRKQKTS